MSWSKIKTILILLFLFVDFFLLFNMYFKTGLGGEVSQQTVNETVAILKNAGITVNPEIVSRKMLSMKKPEISNSLDNRQILAENLIGKSKPLENVYENEKGKITFNAVAFSFENYDKTAVISDIRESNAIECASGYLNDRGFDVQTDAVRDFTSGENGYYIKFGKEIDGYPLYESYLDIYIKPSGTLDKINGYWPEVYDHQSSSTVCVDSTKVLINLLSAEGITNNEIVDIQTGYTLGASPENDSPILLTLLPAYRIIFKTGENYIFDATGGGFLYKY